MALRRRKRVVYKTRVIDIRLEVVSGYTSPNAMRYIIQKLFETGVTSVLLGWPMIKSISVVRIKEFDLEGHER